MATREFEFTSAIVDSSDLPTATDASADNDIPRFSQVARRSSWYDKQASTTTLAAISVADRSDQQVAFVDSKNAFYSFDSASAATDDGDLVIQPDTGTGRWIKITGGSASAISKLQHTLHEDVSTIRAAENIAANDACSVIQFVEDGFLVVKSEADQARRKNSFAGFATAAVTTTQGAYTLTLDAALVTGNVISLELNNRVYTETFASSSDETLNALAVQLNADPNVASAASVQVGPDKLGSDDRVINITSSNGINGSTGAVTILIDNISITGGASQPGFVFATTTPAAGGNVTLLRNGPLAGFSSLTVGKKYFVSDTAGGITLTPTGVGKFVGQAISSTVLFVNMDPTENQFAGLQTYVKSHGGTDGSVDGSSGSASVEHYDFSSWSSGTADVTSLSELLQGASQLDGDHHTTAGINTSDTGVKNPRKYNLTSWTTTVNNNVVSTSGGAQEFQNELYNVDGSTTTAFGGGVSTNQSFDGVSWTGRTSDPVGARSMVSAFVLSSDDELGIANGVNTANSPQQQLREWNGTSWASPGNPPAAGVSFGSATAGGNLGICGIGVSATSTYTWDGTTWSSAITIGYQPMQSLVNGDGNGGANAGFDGSNLVAFNGGINKATSAKSNTEHFNGTSWSSETASSTSKAGAQSSVL